MLEDSHRIHRLEYLVNNLLTKQNADETFVQSNYTFTTANTANLAANSGNIDSSSVDISTYLKKNSSNTLTSVFQLLHSQSAVYPFMI